MNENTVVKECDFKKPDIHEIDYSFDDIIRGCRSKCFHTFEYRLVFDIKFTSISTIEEVHFTNTHRSIEFEAEFYGMNKKSKTLKELVLYLVK